MKYTVKFTSRFKKDYKLLKKRHWDMSLLEKVVELLAEGKKLPPYYRDHALSGKLSGLRDCHIAGDWVLLYEVFDDVLVLVMNRTGTHDDVNLE